MLKLVRLDLDAVVQSCDFNIFFVYIALLTYEIVEGFLFPPPKKKKKNTVYVFQFS